MRDFGSEQDSSHPEIRIVPVTGLDHRNIAVQRQMGTGSSVRAYGHMSIQEYPNSCPHSKQIW